MAGLERRFLISAISYSFVMGALLVALSPRVRSQGNKDGSPLSRSRQFSAMAHDTVAHQFILFGGINNGPNGGGSGPCFNDTWVWSEEGWEEQTPATQPEPRFQAAMAYDFRVRVQFRGNRLAC